MILVSMHRLWDMQDCILTFSSSKNCERISFSLNDQHELTPIIGGKLKKEQVEELIEFLKLSLDE